MLRQMCEGYRKQLTFLANLFDEQSTEKRLVNVPFYAEKRQFLHLGGIKPVFHAKNRYAVSKNSPK
jgi:hypothetical protein